MIEPDPYFEAAVNAAAWHCSFVAECTEKLRQLIVETNAWKKPIKIDKEEYPPESLSAAIQFVRQRGKSHRYEVETFLGTKDESFGTIAEAITRLTNSPLVHRPVLERHDLLLQTIFHGSVTSPPQRIGKARGLKPLRLAVERLALPDSAMVKAELESQCEHTVIVYRQELQNALLNWTPPGGDDTPMVQNGVSLRDVAALRCEGDRDVIRESKKRWHNSRSLPQPLGKDPADKRADLYALSEILNFLKKTEDISDADNRRYKWQLTKELRPIIGP